MMSHGVSRMSLHTIRHQVFLLAPSTEMNNRGVKEIEDYVEDSVRVVALSSNLLLYLQYGA